MMIIPFPHLAHTTEKSNVFGRSTCFTYIFVLPKIVKGVMLTYSAKLRVSVNPLYSFHFIRIANIYEAIRLLMCLIYRNILGSVTNAKCFLGFILLGIVTEFTLCLRHDRRHSWSYERRHTIILCCCLAICCHPENYYANMKRYDSSYHRKFYCTLWI